MIAIYNIDDPARALMVKNPWVQNMEKACVIVLFVLREEDKTLRTLENTWEM